MNSPTTFTTPSGDEMVILSRRDFEAMQNRLDAAEHARAMASVAAGTMETLTEDEVRAALAAPTPLAFWRSKRGMTQTALAEQAGISQSYVADIEAGRRKGAPALFLRLARALSVRMEDIVADED